jgi:hypothetical protein
VYGLSEALLATTSGIEFEIKLAHWFTDGIPSVSAYLFAIENSSESVLAQKYQPKRLCLYSLVVNGTRAKEPWLHMTSFIDGQQMTSSLDFKITTRI